MSPSDLQSLFRDVNLSTFAPEVHADYTIFRVFELGDRNAVRWMRQTFSEDEIRRVLKSEHRLSEKSATFWALVYEVPFHEVSALNRGC